MTAMIPSLETVVSVVSNTKPSRYQGGFTDVVYTTLEAGAQVLDLSHDATTWVPGMCSLSLSVCLSLSLSLSLSICVYVFVCA